MDKTEAQQDLQRRQNLPVVGGVYRHYRGGFYVVQAVSLVEDLRKFLEDAGVLAYLRREGVPEEVLANIPDVAVPVVAYRSNARNTHWLRTVYNFQEEVEVDGGKFHDGSSLSDSAKRHRPRFVREPS